MTVPDAGPDALIERLKTRAADPERRANVIVDACIAAMTTEARAAMGLPEVGWEAVVWGGIGLDEDVAEDEA
jgi:hypothetical protein